ncbi:hypothetical protein OsI_29141 [Oryza sativa Indica Group]|uniref:ABC transporter domain-containing protein n=1 Tax=Oryza sativa subsp. indica TaxID=39946 RepID=B8BAI5_ORYSI|nr:hypothetical protein OsI_29141 [Oryza sativa Indica Group]
MAAAGSCRVRRRLARFFRQVHALLLKNLSFQRRNAKANAAIAAFPALLCVLLVAIQAVIDGELDRPPFRCGCACVRRDDGGRAGACAATECGVQHSTATQALSCAVPAPPRWPAVTQVPDAPYRALTPVHPARCRGDGGGGASEAPCPVAVLTTGQNRRLTEGLGRGLFPDVPASYYPGAPNSNNSSYLDELSTIVPASTAYLKFLRGPNVEMRLEYLKEMPKAAMKIRLDLTTLLDALFFTWTVQLLLPVMLTYLVYEKQHNLRLMMKMHGLKDGPYWMISYAYFLSLSAAYMMFFVMFGSLIALQMTSESNIFCVTVISYIYVFGSSLLGEALLQLFIEDITFPRQWLVTMELVPGFALYRGFYELAEYAFAGRQMGKPGMQWRDLNDPINGMKDVLLLMSIEWILLLPVAFLLDHRPTWHPLFLFGFMSTKHSSPTMIPDKVKQRSRKVFADMAKPDVFLERKAVKKLLKEMDMRNMIICHNLKKVYPGKNGNPDKLAVKGLSLALHKGQCFGMLGPNGAGKTSFINMMIGLVAPTYGTAYIHGMDLRRDMNEIYANIGVCPQHDLLWETLTGREHLMFYGRLKNLTGAALLKAVNESLKSVNLFHSGFGDKSVNKYSGGMKRRLSVAIALIGNPKVVYMDEPSTGLDTTSRSNLWNVIKRAKKNCTIILTTHSMEEAEELCDRVGIFVDGNFQCLGTPKELKARYGGVRALTITTAAGHEEAVERAVARRCPGAAKVYGVGGTQRFEVPRRGARLDGVLGAVEAARRAAPVVAWGVADATLEDVFVRVAMDARAAAHVLS